MAWADLEPHEQELVRDFVRTYRSAMAGTVKGLNTQHLLSVEYTLTISDLWAQIGDAEVIPDGTGLAGADTTMSKAGFVDKFTWTTNLLNAVYKDAGGW